MVSKNHILKYGIVIIPCEECLTCPDFSKACYENEHIEHAVVSACGDCGNGFTVQLHKIVKEEVS